MNSLAKVVFRGLAASAVVGSFSFAAQAAQINTGGETGAYYSKFCPLVKQALSDSQFSYRCATSEGSRENIQRVLKQPTDIGFAQADILAYELKRLDGVPRIATIRSDLGRECLFMVTKNKSIRSFGDVIRSAADLNFVLPPENSGSSGTFEFLRQIDEEGFGKATNIIRADSTDTAIDAVLNNQDDTLVTMFVQFPDPENARFNRIAEGKGRFIPVIDRQLLRQEIGGEKIYYAQKTDVKNPNWLKVGEKVVTACTPLVLFTGEAERVSSGTRRADHRDLMRTLRDMDVSDLQPKEGFFAALFRKTKEISAQSVEALIDMSDKARDSAKPMMDKAVEKSKEIGSKAKEMGADAYDKAKEMGSDVMDRATDFIEENR